MGTLGAMGRGARKRRRNQGAAARLLGVAAALAVFGGVVLVAPHGADSGSDARSDSLAQVRDRFDRAALAVARHEAVTGVGDAPAAAAEAEARLRDLQDRRDQALATGDPEASELERQVATAQQRAFDLDAVATRRAELVESRRRAADVLAAARAAPTATSSGDAWPVWRVVLVVLLFAAAAAVLALAFALALVALRRDRAPRPGRPRPPAARSPRRPVATPTAPRHALTARATPAREPEPEPETRLSLDEIERRLAQLESRTVTTGSETDV